MIPADEMNEECKKCEHLDYGYGCVPTYNNELPPCGRNIVVNGGTVTQEEYKKLKGGEK